MKLLVVAFSIAVAAFGVVKYQRVCRDERRRFTYWPIVLNKWNENDNLRTMKRVLDKMGYRMVDGRNEDWDLMWSIEFPFDTFPDLLEFDMGTKHYKLNHIPGMPFLTNKMALSTGTISKYIPPAFAFPRDRQKYQNFAVYGTNFMFVIKNADNRGVRLIKPNLIDKEDLNSERFVQVFIRDPFLVDGHAFDIGVYVLITSLEPLTIYRYKSECLIRFCPEPYHPFDPLNTRRYVVGDDKLHMWDMPSFRDLDGRFSHVRMFESYFTSHNHNVENLWEQIDDAIVTVTLANHYLMVSELEAQCELYNCSNRNFFELLRFDFIVDGEANVQLMEVNMSPNLTPSKAKFERNSRQYEQVVYNTLRLIGAAGFEIFNEDLRHSPMISRIEDLSVDTDTCGRCLDSCDSASCSHCVNCMSSDFVETLHKTHCEHQRRGEYKRIFPSNLHNENNAEVRELMTEDTKRLSQWFEAKCALDKDWC